MECSWIRIAVGCPRSVGLLAGCNQVGHRLPYQSPSRTQCPLWRGTSLIILNGIPHLLLLLCVILHEKYGNYIDWRSIFWGYSPWHSITGVQKIFCHSLKDVSHWLQTWLCVLWRVKSGLLRFLLLLKWCPIDLQQINIPGLRDDNFLVVPVMLLMIGALKFASAWHCVLHVIVCALDINMSRCSCTFLSLNSTWICSSFSLLHVRICSTDCKVDFVSCHGFVRGGLRFLFWSKWGLICCVMTIFFGCSNDVLMIGALQVLLSLGFACSM